MSIQDRFNTIALRIQDSTSALSPRDRKLLGFLVAFAAVGIVGGTFYMLNNAVKSVQSQVVYREETLRSAQLMAAPPPPLATSLVQPLLTLSFRSFLELL